MTEAKKPRRGRGEGGLYWDEKRQRFIAEVTIGYTPAGKRIVRRGSGKTKTEARAKLKEVLRDHEDGLTIAPQNYTVADAIDNWLAYGLNGCAQRTIDKYTILCRTHIIPAIGARKLRELSADDVDRWLASKAKTLSTSTLGDLYRCLKRAVNRAMARDKVKRNVVVLCDVPTGQAGRPSKSLTMAQAKALLDSAKTSRFYAYIVLSLLIGARTEELRALKWSHVDLDGQPDANPPVPPSIQVWRSVRAGGDTKTRKSRRTLALPERCVAALRRHRRIQDRKRAEAGYRWQDNDLVFCTALGGELLAGNVRRTFRRLTRKADIGDDWTPRELRHSFVSLLSSSGVRIEDIADLCGHAGTRVTEAVYRHQLRPVLLDGAVAMDQIFDARKGGGQAA
ncbi:site-specific integrase [Rugosimonospora africana]|uniref:Site-specific integrase n=1 Tax=Rugosimonospora africana TaxID=556532 RepID=A0A8J3VWM8_9ACTN|nr:site-specific integrase [Rugosimonospora africana]GIH21475.1 site-specific integrase [Rugosimonospora africana]